MIIAAIIVGIIVLIGIITSLMAWSLIDHCHQTILSALIYSVYLGILTGSTILIPLFYLSTI